MIRYHGVPITGEGQPIMALQAKHACVSFEHPGQVEVVAELVSSFILDNGAFSAWKQGRTLDLEGFAAFVDRWHAHPGIDWYLIPDVIDGDVNDNLKMLGRWQQMVSGRIWSLGVPVYHLHEPLEHLRMLVNVWPKVAIGSSGEFAQIGTQAWWQRMADVMAVACDEDGYPKCKLHGLRQLDPTITSHIPYHSADSCNVARNVGIDSAWTGRFAPRSRRMRAEIMIERIESHACASRWVGSGGGALRNHELFG
jgi:hypothetical protein